MQKCKVCIFACGQQRYSLLSFITTIFDPLCSSLAPHTFCITTPTLSTAKSTTLHLPRTPCTLHRHCPHHSRLDLFTHTLSLERFSSSASVCDLYVRLFTIEAPLFSFPFLTSLLLPHSIESQSILEKEGCSLASPFALDPTHLTPHRSQDSRSYTPVQTNSQLTLSAPQHTLTS